MQALKIQIAGMKCEYCVAAVQNALTRLPGVRTCRVHVGMAELSFDDNATKKPDLFDAIRQAGTYEVSGFSTIG